MVHEDIPFKILNNYFFVSAEQMIQISRLFYESMLLGLNGEISSLKMLPSYMNRPSGEEKGEYLAIDFGGTNLRISLIELLGKGNFKISKSLSYPLDVKNSGYDLISEKSSASDLFGFIACNIRQIIKPKKKYSLGHTFSFPTKQTGPNSSTLLNWTKEIKTNGIVGADVNALLTEALRVNGLDNVFPKVIINDTVGTLLASVYRSPNSNIGSICGTGHNTCYFETSAQAKKVPMIINIESGNFDNLPFNKYDNLLDMNSEKPGEQRLEKMVGGKYLGEILRLVILDFAESNIFLKNVNIGLLNETLTKTNISAKDISEILSDNTLELELINNFINSRFYSDSSLNDRIFLQKAAQLLIQRAAKLVASTYIGILHKIDPNQRSEQTISIDGSIYEKIPMFQEYLKISLDNILGEKSKLITIQLTKDGSGVGAAVAAAMFSEKL